MAPRNSTPSSDLSSFYAAHVDQGAQRLRQAAHAARARTAALTPLPTKRDAIDGESIEDLIDVNKSLQRGTEEGDEACFCCVQAFGLGRAALPHRARAGLRPVSVHWWWPGPVH